jgi:hypothetical protein
VARGGDRGDGQRGRGQHHLPAGDRGGRRPGGAAAGEDPEYSDKFANPYVAAASGHVDALIDPAETRRYLLHALEVSQQKKTVRPERKHGVPPF